MKTIDRIRSMAQQLPESPAYSFRNQRLTYGQLWDMASKLASGLRDRGARTCVLVGGKEPQMPIAILGCLIAGVTYIPVSESVPAKRLEWILMAAQADMIISQSAVFTGGIPRWTVDQLLSCSPMTVVPEDGAQTCYIIFTSGSTGEPKGVPISRDNLDNFTDWICAIPELERERRCRVLNQASFSFDLSVADLYYAFCSGHELVALDSALTTDPSGLHDFWQREEPNVCVCTPTFLKLCLMDPEYDAAHLPGLRTVYCCGERLDPSLAARALGHFPKLNLINAYGPTEATSAVCAVRISREMTEQKELPAGDLRTAACNIFIEDGEIVLQGKSVFSGYLNQIHGGYFVKDGENAFHTGDYGRIEGEYLYCGGRKDRQIKWMGYRIELDEIEKCISTQPGVRDCAVTVKRTASGEVRMIKAYVVIEDTAAQAQQENREGSLRAQLSGLLPFYMIPKSIAFVDSLPVNANGKIDRKGLTE